MKFKHDYPYIHLLYLVILSLCFNCGQSRFLRIPDTSLTLHVPSAITALQIDDSMENYGGPVSLEDYCAMKQGKFVRRQKVRAVPHAGGPPKPGVVVKANEGDKSVDVLFKSGDHDMNIPVAQVTPRELPEAFHDHDDSACIVEGPMSQVQADVDKAYDEIKAWLRRRQGKEGDAAAAEDKRQAEAKAKAEADAKKKLAATEKEEKAAEKKLEETQQEEAEAKKELKEATNAKDIASAKENLEEVEAKEQEQKDQLKDIQAEEDTAKKDMNEAQEKDVANAGDVEDMAKKLGKTIKDLEDAEATLGKQGKLDPELKASMTEVMNEAKQARLTLHKVGEAEAKGGDNLVATVEAAEKELKDAKDDMAVAESGIYPSGDKWWRYRYEFSYVEAMFAVLMSIIALIGECVLHFLRKAIAAQAQSVQWQDERSVPTMYSSWLQYLGSEGLVLLWMNVAGWLLWATAPWVFESWANLNRDPRMHLPLRIEQYTFQAWETLVHLSLAMIMYFLAIYMVVYHASNRLRRWQHWSSNTDPGDETPRVHLSLSVSVIASRTQMKALRNLFLSEVRMRPDLLEFASTHKVALNDDFPFFLYLSHCMHQYLKDVFIVRIWTWFFIVIIFGLFAICHRYAHLGTAELILFFGLGMIVVFAVMTYGVYKAIEKISKERHRLTDTSRVFDSDMKSQKDFEHALCASLQLIVFFLCFGAVRLIFSHWMWRLYPWYTLLITIGLLVFTVLWLFFLAPLISAFMAVLCVPPYVHRHSFEKTVKIMRPPEMTSLPPNEITESVERIEGLVDKLDK